MTHDEKEIKNMIQYKEAWLKYYSKLTKEEKIKLFCETMRKREENKT